MRRVSTRPARPTSARATIAQSSPPRLFGGYVRRSAEAMKSNRKSPPGRSARATRAKNRSTARRDGRYVITSPTAITASHRGTCAVVSDATRNRARGACCRASRIIGGEAEHVMAGIGEVLRQHTAAASRLDDSRTPQPVPPEDAQQLRRDAGGQVAEPSVVDVGEIGAVQWS